VDDKHLSILEFPKILTQLAAYTSFAASAELAQQLRPVSDIQEIRWHLEVVSEGRALLDAKPDTTVGGARDVRARVAAAERGAVLLPEELLDIRGTLIAARTLHRKLTRLDTQFPHLAAIAGHIILCPGVISEIGRCLDDRGVVRDDASNELARIRHEVRVAHDRVQDKLQRIIGSPRNTPALQEPIITQRDGRYVIPVKADFKGRIQGVVHDVSASGATVFLEPLSVVALNNAWRELEIKEQQEIKRILDKLSDLVAQHADEIAQTVSVLADLDLIFAKAKYAEVLSASAPKLVAFHKPQTADNGYQHPGSTVRLLGARHPLIDPQRVVPIDVVLDDDTSMLVITGPNTGGKTVSLKTAGLLTLMVQAGLHIPVEPQSEISPFENVYADIGDEQSIEQSLSTFSSHLTNIISFLDKADEHSLVLLDELGAGTDPAEGSALARAILEYLRNRKVTTLVATHYPELKGYAQLTPGVRNACVEFDPETLRPTYKLTIGLPGRSNAFAIAQYIGLPEEIVASARGLVSRDSVRTEDMLADIHRLRIQAAKERDAASASRAEADKQARALRDRLEAIEQERREILDQAHTAAQDELDALQTEIRSLRRRLQVAAAPLDELIAVEETAEDLEIQYSEPEPIPTPPEPMLQQKRPIRPGDTVFVQPLKALGEVLSLSRKEAEVQVGSMRTRLPLASLERRKGSGIAREEPPTPISVTTPSAPSPGTRLDLRGLTVDEAVEHLDRHLDAASRAGLPWIHIIHGKGTGALRSGVRRFLSDHPLVSSYESGGDKEGGAGVTVAKLVQA